MNTKDIDKRNWGERFDDEFPESYFIDGDYMGAIVEANGKIRDIKLFIKYLLLDQIDDEIRELEESRKEVCGCTEDEHPQAPGYHTKYCNLEPYGYNKSIDDQITRLKAKREDFINNKNNNE